ncbi:MAG: hypothetical protein SGPRY_000332 [Prymnesium sp.]
MSIATTPSSLPHLQHEAGCERERHSLGRPLRTWKRVRAATTALARSVALGAFLLVPGRVSLPRGVELMGRPQAIAARVADKETAAAVEVLLEPDQPSVIVKVGKLAAVGGVVGVSVAAVVKVWLLLVCTAIASGKSVRDEQEKARKAEAQAYLESMLKSEKALADASHLCSTLSHPQPLCRSLGEQGTAARLTPPGPPPPKRQGLNLFSKRKEVNVPTELTAGDSPEAQLCKTIAFGIGAPTDLTAAMISGQTSDIPIEDNSEAIFAMSSDAAQVGRARLIELVDSAVDALSRKDDFPEAASQLCRFVSNAGFAVQSLKLSEVVSEVLYEGSEPRRRLERLYSGCLALAAPELLATMGIGNEEELTGAVGLDAVEQLRQLLKIKESSGEKLMQDVIKTQMVEVMKGDSDGAGGGKAIARSVEMIEQILNSGNIDKEDLESLKAMLSKSMGMPVEEVLERKEELQKELPPEGKKLFDLIERLFAKDGGGEMKSAEAADSEVDPDLLGADEMKVTVKKVPIKPDDEDAPPAPGTSVKIRANELPADFKPYVPYGGKQALMKPPMAPAVETPESAVASDLLDKATPQHLHLETN